MKRTAQKKNKKKRNSHRRGQGKKSAHRKIVEHIQRGRNFKEGKLFQGVLNKQAPTY